MKNLNQHLADYLKLRRQLGYKLKEAEFLLRNFVHFIEQEGTGVITAKLAVRWAARPNIKPAQSGSRLSVVRRFAAYVSAHDARTEVPAQKLLPYHLCRRDPYHYTDEDVQRLINAARQIDRSGQIKGPTLATLFGLLAVTGMRVGEALALDCRDVDLKRALLTVRLAKGIIACQIGLRQPGDLRGPRVHDLRHYFAIRTLLNWYQSGADVEAHLPELATYLGHVHVRDSYWYLSAVPELLKLATLRWERAEKGTA